MSNRNNYNSGCRKRTLEMKCKIVTILVATIIVLTTGPGYAGLTDGLVGYWSFDDPSSFRGTEEEVKSRTRNLQSYSDC